MLKLAKTEISPMLEQRMVRFMTDMRALQELPTPQVRAIYSELEYVRNALSELLERADGKN